MAIVGIIFSLASLGLGPLPYGLFARKIQTATYYAVLVSTLGQLLHGDIIGAIIGIVISMYVLLKLKNTINNHICGNTTFNTFFYVYVLKSSKDGNRYIGYTNNLKRRIKNIMQGIISPQNLETL